MGMHFMHSETFEQINLQKDFIENSDLMKEGQNVEILFHTENETPSQVPDTTRFARVNGAVCVGEKDIPPCTA